MKPHCIFSQLHNPQLLLQDGFHDFVNRCEGAEFEDSMLAQQGKMSLRDLHKVKNSAGNQFATKPASELAMDAPWEVSCLHGKLAHILYVFVSLYITPLHPLISKTWLGI